MASREYDGSDARCKSLASGNRLAAAACNHSWAHGGVGAGDEGEAARGVPSIRGEEVWTSAELGSSETHLARPTLWILAEHTVRAVAPARLTGEPLTRPGLISLRRFVSAPPFLFFFRSIGKCIEKFK